MSSHVYVLQHAEQPWIKIGKADVLLTRCRLLGLSRFDLHASFAVEVASSAQALRLESVLHRLFADARIPSEQVLALDSQMAGFTEWFDASCRAQLDRVLSSICERIPHRRIEPAEFRAKMQQFVRDEGMTSQLRDLRREHRRRETEERAERQRAQQERHEQALAAEATDVRRQLCSLEPILLEFTGGLAQAFLIPPASQPAHDEFRALLLGTYDATPAPNGSARLASFQQSAAGQAFQALRDTHIDRPVLQSWVRLCANPQVVVQDNGICVCLDLYWTERAEQAAWSPSEVFREFRLRVPGWDVALRAEHMQHVLEILKALKLRDGTILNGGSRHA